MAKFDRGVWLIEFRNAAAAFEEAKAAREKAERFRFESTDLAPTDVWSPEYAAWGARHEIARKARQRMIDEAQVIQTKRYKEWNQLVRRGLKGSDPELSFAMVEYFWEIGEFVRVYRHLGKLAERMGVTDIKKAFHDDPRMRAAKARGGHR